jgi:hypothetical protein
MDLRLFSRIALPVAGALALAFLHPHQNQVVRAQSDLWERVRMIYDSEIAAGAAQAQNKPVPQAQDGHEWDGLAIVIDPVETTRTYDIHEFDVLPNFDNDAMQVKITWESGPGIAYDLDLYVERQIDGQWNPVGQSTNGQALGEGTPEESLTVSNPAPGRYRTRVHNWASHQVAYHGSISFTSDGVITKDRKIRVAGGRATEDRPDVAIGSQVHTIYFVPSDGADNQLDINGTLDDALAAMNGWFASETGGFQIRLDTYADRKAVRPDVTFVRGLRTTAEYAGDPDGAFTAVTDELEERGWTASPGVKRYLVYYEGPAESAGICGTAYLTTGAGFAQWSVVFLGASPGCGARDFGTPATGAGVSESIAVQEMLHNEGQTRPEAPHHCVGLLNHFHICTALVGSQLERVQRGLDPESVDALFPYVTFRLADKKLDKDRDDYYNHPFLHRDLASSPFWEMR